MFLKCDLSDEQRVTEELSSLINNLNSQEEHVSILINNAGIRDNKGLIDLDPERIKSMFNINTLLPIWILQKVITNHIDIVLPKTHTPNCLLLQCHPSWELLLRKTCPYTRQQKLHQF